MSAGGELHDRVHRRLLDDADTGIDRDRVQALVRSEAPLADGSLADRTVEQVMARVEGLGPLEPLLADPDVTEVMVNGDGSVWAERNGRVEPAGEPMAAATTRLLIERIVTPLGLRVDRSSPMVDARLVDGSRVNAVVPPLAVDGPCLTIRRFGARAVPLDAIAPGPTGEILRGAVQERANVVVSGGSGAGKTTLLNALGADIEASERIITVEDAAELRLPGRHVVRLESRPANADGQGAVTIRDLVRNALRMRPDRIVVGEVRGAECFDLVQACNTGHDGTLSTCHANSPLDALRRLETLALMADVDLPLTAVREQVHAGLDVIVQVARGVDGSRAVVAVAEVAPAPGPERVRLLVAEGQVVGAPGRAPRRPRSTSGSDSPEAAHERAGLPGGPGGTLVAPPGHRGSSVPSPSPRSSGPPQAAP
jgi:pilus assembly protein CpaF